MGGWAAKSALPLFLFVPEPNTKLCHRCGSSLPTSSFARNRATKDGLQGVCKPCQKIYRDLYRSGEKVKKPLFDAEGNLIKACTRCGDVLTMEGFYKQANSHTSECSECIKKRNGKYQSEHKDRHNLSTKDSDLHLKLFILLGYGGKCKCCGERDLTFLTLDHVNGRKAQGHSLSDVASKKHYRDAMNRFFPEDYQVLCYNCNCAKGFFGICPHQGTPEYMKSDPVKRLIDEKYKA